MERDERRRAALRGLRVRREASLVVHPRVWPFWAPTPDDTVGCALDLASLQPGERLVDLGCGDGRILLAAGERGAVGRGGEADADLAAETRAALADHGVEGTVSVGDMFAADLSGDVVFAYLSPATVQRLVPNLSRLRRGTRVVTIQFAIPGLVPDATGQDCYLYVAPFRRRPLASRPGWRSRGALVGFPADEEYLVGIEPRHPGGKVEVELSGPLADAATARPGADRVKRGEAVAIDLRWHALPEGTVVRGDVHVSGLRPFPVVGVVGGDQHAVWLVTWEGWPGVERRWAGRRPVTVKALLAAAQREVDRRR